MPIFSYFAVIGSVLVALLFVADAKLEKRGPMPFNNESAGLPKAWQPETGRHQQMGSTLVVTPAPAPDMSSEAVKIATPAPGPHIADVPHAAETSGRAQADATSKPPKRVVRKQPRRDGDRQNYAWSPNGDHNPSGGLFGRF